MGAQSDASSETAAIAGEQSHDPPGLGAPKGHGGSSMLPESQQLLQRPPCRPLWTEHRWFEQSAWVHLTRSAVDPQLVHLGSNKFIYWGHRRSPQQAGFNLSMILWVNRHWIGAHPAPTSAPSGHAHTASRARKTARTISSRKSSLRIMRLVKNSYRV
jgi:hypothetical protein